MKRIINIIPAAVKRHGVTSASELGSETGLDRRTCQRIMKEETFIPTAASLQTIMNVYNESIHNLLSERERE